MSTAATNYRVPRDSPPVAYTSTPSRPLQPGDPGYVTMDGKPWRPRMGRDPDPAGTLRSARLLAAARFAGSRKLLLRRLAEIDHELDAIEASLRNSGDEAGANEVALMAALAGRGRP